MAEEQPALELLYQQIDRVGGMRLDKTALRERLFASRSQHPAQLASLAAPVLFIGGEEDPVIPACGVEAVAAATPKGRFVAVPKAGHSVYFERASQFNALVEGFLAEIGWAA
jgi:3-oxoadipate enol-lactonase